MSKKQTPPTQEVAKDPVLDAALDKLTQTLEQADGATVENTAPAGDTAEGAGDIAGPAGGTDAADQPAADVAGQEPGPIVTDEVKTEVVTAQMTDDVADLEQVEPEYEYLNTDEVWNLRNPVSGDVFKPREWTPAKSDSFLEAQVAYGRLKRREV